MDSLPGLVGYVDLDLQIVFANRLIEDWYQRPRSELVGIALKSLFTEDHYQAVKVLLQRVLSGEEVNEEREISYPDGVTRTVHLNYIPDRSESGILGYFFLVRDVTQRRAAEEALRQANAYLDRKVREATLELQKRNEELLLENIARQRSEERYRIVSELMSDLIYVYEIDRHGAMKTIWQTGKLSEEFSPQYTVDGHHRLWRPIIHPDDTRILDDRIERLLHNENSIDEFRVIDNQGNVRWLRAFGRPIWDEGENRVVQIMVAAQDITETKSAESQLQRNRRMLSAALESMTEGFMLFDGEGKLVEFNEKLKQLFPGAAPSIKKGETFETLLRASVESGELELTGPDAERWIEQRLQAYHSNSGSNEVELADGRWILSTDRRTHDGGVVGIRTDITDRKVAEERRRRHEAELAQVLRRASMGEMASALAHELSQPLAVVVNYANGMLRRLEEDNLNTETTREALQNISNASQRAKDILNHVGDFVRYSAPDVKPESVLLIINDVCEMLRGNLLRNSIEMQREMQEDDELLVAVNKIEIEQVLFNLLTNSIDSLQKCDISKPVIQITCERENADRLLITVQDNGNGIDDEIAENLFDPYVSTKSGGLGMGLSISRTIVEAHGGRLWFDSPGNGGARFYVRLPVGENVHG